MVLRKSGKKKRSALETSTGSFFLCMTIAAATANAETNVSNSTKSKLKCDKERCEYEKTIPSAIAYQDGHVDGKKTFKLYCTISGENTLPDKTDIIPSSDDVSCKEKSPSDENANWTCKNSYTHSKKDVSVVIECPSSTGGKGKHKERS